MRDPAVPQAAAAEPGTPGREAALEQQVHQLEARLAQNTRFYGERERVHLERLWATEARLREAERQPGRAQEPSEEEPSEEEPSEEEPSEEEPSEEEPPEEEPPEEEPPEADPEQPPQR